MLFPASGFVGKGAFSTKAFVADPQATLSIIVPVSSGPWRSAIPLFAARVAEVAVSGETLGVQELLAQR